MFRTLLFTAVAAVALTGAAPAQPPAQLRGDAVVRYDDLDLSREADARTLLKRLEAAAEDACGRRPSLRGNRPGLETFLKADFHDCRAAAINNAVLALKAPVVTRLFAQSAAHQPNQIANR
jgi:UrcA family protein